MKNLYALTVVSLVSLTVIAGCASKPTEFKELVAKEVQKQDVVKSALESPTAITVSIDNDRRIFLNKESVGTVKDTGRLKQRLPQLFEEKKHKTVFIQAPHSISDEELSGLVAVIKEAGAGPVGLSREER